jgi:hypothetical protein
VDHCQAKSLQIPFFFEHVDVEQQPPVPTAPVKFSQANGVAQVV